MSSNSIALDTSVAIVVLARLRLGLKEKGKPIPEMAALCVEHQVKLAAVDGHFDGIDELLTETV